MNFFNNDWQIYRLMPTYCGNKEFLQSVGLKIQSVNNSNILDKLVSKIVLRFESKEKVDENVLEYPPREP